VREILKETGVTTEAERVLAAEATNRAEHANGDRTVLVDATLVCRPTSGIARVSDTSPSTWAVPDEAISFEVLVRQSPRVPGVAGAGRDRRP